MAHSKHRISIPLNAETVEALKKLASVTGGSIGGTAGQFLDGLTPNFLALAEAYDVCRTDPVRGALLLQKQVLEANQEVNEEQLDLIERSLS